MTNPNQIEQLEAALDAMEWTRDWPHNIVPPGLPAQTLACDLIRNARHLIAAVKNEAKLREALERIKQFEWEFGDDAGATIYMRRIARNTLEQTT